MTRRFTDRGIIRLVADLAGTDGERGDAARRLVEISGELRTATSAAEVARLSKAYRAAVARLVGIESGSP